MGRVRIQAVSPGQRLIQGFFMVGSLQARMSEMLRLQRNP